MFKFKNPFKAFGRKPAKRGYGASATSRLLSDWTITNKTPDAELRTTLRTLRARSRDLERNNDYAKRFLAMVQANVVGSGGIKMQSRAKNPDGKLDKPGNRIIEEFFKEWGRPGICTVDGQQSWIDAQRLFIRSIARDGEVLFRFVTGRNAKNEFGFAIQFLEADWLDETFDEDLRNGNTISLSVEKDSFGRPVGYWLLSKHPGDDKSSLMVAGKERTRVSADELKHKYIIDRPGQTRGVPWMVSAMTRLQQLGGYEEAELIAARIGASKMGFITSEAGESFSGDDVDSDGAAIMDMEPGLIEELAQGTSFTPFDPQHPTSAFRDFVKTSLRGVAAGLGVSYNSLAQDLEGVNFSSLRHGNKDEQDHWKVLQTFAINHFCQIVFDGWLKSALLHNAIRLPPDSFNKFRFPVWQPRGWAFVDPMKEVKADIEAINAGLKSRQSVLSEQGRDLEETFEQIASENQMADEIGVPLDGGGTKGDIPNAQKEEDEIGND